MSYRKKHVKNKIGRITPKKSIFAKLWFWLAFLFFVVVLSAFYFVLFYPGFYVKDIIISGNEKVGREELQSFVLSEANTGLVSFWKINVTSKSILLINQEKLSDGILEKFPVIEKLKIDKNFPQTLTLGVIERKPLGVFCSSAGSERCFLVDSNGIAFEPVSVAQENLAIVRQTVSDKQVFTGEEVVAKNMADAIYKIQKNLKDNFKIDLKEALVTSSIRLNVKTGENWQIYFDTDSSANIDSQITKLNLLLNGEISQSDREKLHYIDLRPEDRAIICDNSVCGG